MSLNCFLVVSPRSKATRSEIMDIFKALEIFFQSSSKNGSTNL